ncbi:hypothetical protein E2C01_082151 [Portunus trituberculatus]|uniref:Secreted protein n=1 Tax=Portunus trituberculatus TaxID=210409 RepID=A0A5B7IYF7_PORTR|nr:hypothetical protein [Portunus trituberculatus]
MEEVVVVMVVVVVVLLSSPLSPLHAPYLHPTAYYYPLFSPHKKPSTSTPLSSPSCPASSIFLRLPGSICKEHIKMSEE